MPALRKTQPRTRGGRGQTPVRQLSPVATVDRYGWRRGLRRRRRKVLGSSTCRPVGAWCGPCRMVSPALGSSPPNAPDDSNCVKVDVDKAPAISQRFTVQAVPTLLLLDHGQDNGAASGRCSRCGATQLAGPGTVGGQARRRHVHDICWYGSTRRGDSPGAPARNGCEECLRLGTPWVHLRLCLTCGHVGCCDSSPMRHARAHAHTVGHPIVQSMEPGETWRWCYVDEDYV